MPRPRKRHIQQSLFKKRGGKRAGAGRPITPGRYRASERHRARPKITKATPVHVTLRVVEVLHVLRTLDAYKAVRRAMLCVYRRRDFRIVGVSIEQSHVHLLVEAHDKTALARGMQGFEVSAAKHLNAMTREVARDSVQAAAARQGVRRPLQRRGHHESAPGASCVELRAQQLAQARGGPRARAVRVRRSNPFSSANAFDGWAAPVHGWPSTYEPLPVRAPGSWLLSAGWRMYGLIDPREVPGRRARVRAAH